MYWWTCEAGILRALSTVRMTARNVTIQGAREAFCRIVKRYFFHLQCRSRAIRVGLLWVLYQGERFPLLVTRAFSTTVGFSRAKNPQLTITRCWERAIFRGGVYEQTRNILLPLRWKTSVCTGCNGNVETDARKTRLLEIHPATGAEISFDSESNWAIEKQTNKQRSE